MQIFKSKPFINSVRQYINIKKSLLSKTNDLLKTQITGFKRHVGRSTTDGMILAPYELLLYFLSCYFYIFYSYSCTCMYICKHVYY